MASARRTVGAPSVSASAHRASQGPTAASSPARTIAIGRATALMGCAPATPASQVASALSPRSPRARACRVRTRQLAAQCAAQPSAGPTICAVPDCRRRLLGLGLPERMLGPRHVRQHDVPLRIALDRTRLLRAALPQRLQPARRLRQRRVLLRRGLQRAGLLGEHMPARLLGARQMRRLRLRVRRRLRGHRLLPKVLPQQ